jgi:hypothetical protein
MAKEQLKREIIEVKGNTCAITEVDLPEELSLIDTHRKPQKAEGGIYLIKTTDVVDPVAHMKKHFVYRERTPDMEELKSICDDRNQVIKAKNKMLNQILALKRRTDHRLEEVEEFLTEQLEPFQQRKGQYDRKVTAQLKKIENEKYRQIRDACLSVKNIGPVTTAYCLVYLDLEGVYPDDHPYTPGKEKARHASSLWKYVGLDAPSHKRYPEKGTQTVGGGGNKTLRTVLYTMADSQVKGRGPYREVYDNVKHRLEHSSREVQSRNTQGKLVTVAWKDTKPCHRHGAALRAVMKHFLADYWMVGRTILGLNTTPIYAEAHLGGTHRTIMPKERGWVY